jgi:hypothetical protein
VFAFSELSRQVFPVSKTVIWQFKDQQNGGLKPVAEVKRIFRKRLVFRRKIRSAVTHLRFGGADWLSNFVFDFDQTLQGLIKLAVVICV